MTKQKKCLECGHIDSKFLQPATVDCMAIVDADGEFEWWKTENFENPNFEHGVLLCNQCESDQLADVAEVESVE